MKNAWRSILAILLCFLRSYHISVTFCRYTLNIQRKTGHRQDMITISTCQLSGCLSRLAPMEWDSAESCMLCSIQIGVMPGLLGVSMGHTPSYPSIPLPSPIWMWMVVWDYSLDQNKLRQSKASQGSLHLKKTKTRKRTMSRIGQNKIGYFSDPSQCATYRWIEGQVWTNRRRKTRSATARYMVNVWYGKIRQDETIWEKKADT